MGRKIWDSKLVEVTFEPLVKVLLGMWESFVKV
jgi:hypothetical protein